MNISLDDRLFTKMTFLKIMKNTNDLLWTPHLKRAIKEMVLLGTSDGWRACGFQRMMFRNNFQTTKEPIEAAGKK